MLKPMLALYIGGMGARGQELLQPLAQRYGYEEAAAKIQELYLDGQEGRGGDRAVPDELVDEVALVGAEGAHRRAARGLARGRRLDAGDPGAAAGGARGDGGAAAVRDAFAAALGAPVERAVLLAGGASKEAWAVDSGGRELLIRRAAGGVIHQGNAVARARVRSARAPRTRRA